MEFYGLVLASLPLEVERLCQRSVNGIGGNVSTALLVLGVVDTQITGDDEDGVLPARREDGRDEVKAVAVGIISTCVGKRRPSVSSPFACLARSRTRTIYRADEVRSGSCLLQVALD